jgi:hypothetical protein
LTLLSSIKKNLSPQMSADRRRLGFSDQRTSALICG